MSKEIKNLNQSFGKLLCRAYQFKYPPVGIKFLKKQEDFFNFPKAKQKRPVCAFIKIAAQGESFYIDKTCISCPGGLKWMGFPSRLTETRSYKFFLAKIEKLKKSPETVAKFINFLPKPPQKGLYEKILFAPLEDCKFEPDVVVAITSPRQAYRLVAAAYFNDHLRVKTIPLCAACHGSIAIPFTTGEVNISMIDPLAREYGEFKDEEVLVGIPKPRFASLINNLKETPYGLGKKPVVAKIIKKFLI